MICFIKKTFVKKYYACVYSKDKAYSFIAAVKLWNQWKYLRVSSVSDSYLNHTDATVPAARCFVKENLRLLCSAGFIIAFCVLSYVIVVTVMA